MLDLGFLNHLCLGVLAVERAEAAGGAAVLTRLARPLPRRRRVSSRLTVAGAAACGFFEFIFTRVLGMLAGDHAAWGHGRRPFVDMLGAPRPAAELAARTGCPGTVIGLYPTAGDGGDVSSVDAGRMPETGVLTPPGSRASP